MLKDQSERGKSDKFQSEEAACVISRVISLYEATSPKVSTGPHVSIDPDSESVQRTVF